MARALSLHAAVLARPPAKITAEDLAEVAASWDAVRADPDTRSRAESRAVALGCQTTGAQAIDRIALSVEEDLVAAARAAEVSLAPERADASGPTLRGAEMRLRDELLSELELACEALGGRVAMQRELPVVDEWCEFQALRRLAERARRLGGEEVRRLAFPPLHREGVKLPVWLYNQRGQRPMANAMFRWLLAEAQAVGDARATELERKNVACAVL
jgi:hypothetical protein